MSNLMTPWSSVAQDVGNVSIREAIETAKLNWKVNLCNISIHFDDKVTLSGNHYRAIVREDTQQIFGIGTKSYSVVQNIDAFSYYEGLVENKYLKLDTAGSTKGGRHIFVSAQPLKDGEEIPEAEHQLLVRALLTNAHDRSSDVGLSLLCLRRLSNNKLIKIGRPITILRRRHTSNVSKSLDASKEALKRGFVAINNLARSCDLMAKVILNTDEALNTYLYDVLGVEDPTNPKNYNIKKFQQFKELFHARNGKTLLDAYSAVSEQVCWYNGRSDDSRVDNALFGSGVNLLGKAFALGVNLAK